VLGPVLIPEAVGATSTPVLTKVMWSRCYGMYFRVVAHSASLGFIRQYVDSFGALCDVFSLTLPRLVSHSLRFTEKPTKEQEEEMDRLEEIAKGGGPTEGADDAELYLQNAVKELEWNLGSRPGLKAAAEGLAQILKNQPDDAAKLAVPEDEKELLKKVGAFITANKEKSPEELVPHLVEHFGLKQAKEKKVAAKQEAVAKQVQCEANGALVSAFQELMELYAKQKNNNATNTYKKVVAAISDIDFAITEENAKGLCKGKTKIQNIGKSTVDKIVEFLETGTMTKLEEKRAEAS
jgi:Helix-hairpin-helix domain